MIQFASTLFEKLHLMSDHIRISSILNAFLLLLMVFGFHPAHAQSSEGIRIIPAVVEDKVKPGDTYRFNLSVTNLADTEKTFYLVTQDISGLDDRGLPIFSKETEVTEYEMSSWIELPETAITMKAGETRSVPFNVLVPSSASPGSHFGGVFLDMLPPKLRTIGTGVGVKVGSLISLRVAGDILEEARLREFSTEKVIYNEPTVLFNSKVENLGNVLLRPQGFIEITDMFGKQIANVRVNESGGSVFPKSERMVETTWKYDEFAFGRYQAVLSLVYGIDERKTIYSTTSFWVLPLKPILTALGILFVLIIGLYVSVRMYIQKKLREMGGSSRRVDANFYAKKYQRSSSLLTMVVLAGFLVCVAFLFLLFLMFA